jgi:predicted GNAT family acetyltransferase
MSREANEAVVASARGTVSNVADDITVVHRADERRYELLVGGEHAGELVYRDRGSNVLAFLHTEVDQTLQRRGLGSALVAGALDDARERGFRVVPLCPFVAAYVRRHPADVNLVVEDPSRGE